ncbi:MAG: tetratricopeptide repeat protein [Thermoanaerobaculia bacterium]
MKSGITRAVLAAILFSLAIPAAAQAGREARLTVELVGENGAPVGNASVLVTTPSLSSYRKALKTDSGGRVNIVLIDGDWKYVVRGEKSGFMPSQTELQVPAGGSRTVSLTLHPPASAAGEAPAGDDSDSLFASGMKLYNAGDFRAAGAAFARATQLRRDVAKNYYWLAMCEWKMKRFAESRATFQRYLQMAPDGEQARSAREMLAASPN